MRVLEEIRYAWRQVVRHWQTYLKTMFIMQGLKTIIAVPLLSYIFFALLSKAGFSSLTNDNISGLLESPLMLVVAILFLWVFALMIFYELGLYFLLVETHRQQKKERPRELLRRLNKKAKYFLSIYALFFIVYFLLLLPVVSIGLDSDLTQMIKIPDFIVDEVLLTPGGAVGYGLLLLALSYLALRLIYLIYFFVCDEQLTIWQSIRQSWDYSRGRSFHNLLVLALSGLIFVGVLGGLSFVCFLPLIIVERVWPLAAPVFAGLALTGVQLLVFFLGGLTRPFLANGIVATTLTSSPQVGEKGRGVSVFQVIGGLDKRLKGLAAVGLGVLVFANSYATVEIVYAPQTEIIAHRGFMEKGVENSLTALVAAQKAGADMVELDIQETADGQFIVMHDYNLKRLAQVDQQVHELTLAELKKLSLKQNQFEERIPSLEEFITTAVELKVGLLIEFKPHGHESPEMAENLVALLREMKVSETFLVQSLDLKALDDIKALGPEIQTGYVLPLNLGRLPASDHDFYVLEEFSLTEGTLAEAKALKKKLFVWTVNQDALMLKYFRLDVDGLITNHPDLAVALRDDHDVKASFLNRVTFLLE